MLLAACSTSDGKADIDGIILEAKDNSLLIAENISP